MLIHTAIRHLLNGLFLKVPLAFQLNRCSEIIQMISLYFDDQVMQSCNGKNKMRCGVNGHNVYVNTYIPLGIVIINE